MDSRILDVMNDAAAGLPHRNADAILKLNVHYFEPADFMLQQLQKLDHKALNGNGLSQAKIIERRYYLMFWLSGLYVTMEGVFSLPLDIELKNRPFDIPEIATSIPNLIEQFGGHRDSLRLLRNAQFHYQKTAQKHIQFFEDED